MAAAQLASPTNGLIQAPCTVQAAKSTAHAHGNQLHIPSHCTQRHSSRLTAASRKCSVQVKHVLLPRYKLPPRRSCAPDSSPANCQRRYCWRPHGQLQRGTSQAVALQQAWVTSILASAGCRSHAVPLLPALLHQLCWGCPPQASARPAAPLRPWQRPCAPPCVMPRCPTGPPCPPSPHAQPARVTVGAKEQQAQRHRAQAHPY